MKVLIGKILKSQGKFGLPWLFFLQCFSLTSFSLSPLCDIYKDMTDSYIVELKYCKSNTTDEQVKRLFEEASAQIRRYADSDIVREEMKSTKLHKLVVIYRGTEMVACQEVE